MPNKKKDCCPEPSQLRVFRRDTRTSNQPALVYTVPADKVVIINSFTTCIFQAPNDIRLLRSGEVVAQIRPNGTEQPSQSQVFPTGIAFFSGDTIEIDHTNNANISYIYGYEIDA